MFAIVVSRACAFAAFNVTLFIGSYYTTLFVLESILG